MRRFHVSPIVIAVLALAISAPACADDVTFTGFAHGSESVDFTLVAPNAPTSGSASAGGFATVLNGGPSFVTYCVDVYQHISFDTLYPEYTGPDTSHVFTNSRAYDDLGRLYNVAGVVNTSVAEAAFQIAVWEIAYETTPGPYDLASGAAQFSGGSASSSGALTLAATWLGELASAPTRPIEVLQSSDHQDVIFAPVPEPSSVALMLSGLVAAGTVARRRSRKAKDGLGNRHAGGLPEISYIQPREHGVPTGRQFGPNGGAPVPGAAGVHSPQLHLSRSLSMKLLAGLLRPRAVALVAGTVAAIACGTASAQTTFAGSTAGCFGTSCTPTASATLTSSGLTYANSTFSVISAGGFASIGDGPGTPNTNNLGSFTLTGAPFNYAGSTFSLQVTFTAPPGTTPGQTLVTSSISGMVNATDNGGIFVNFDNTPRHFTFGSGATAGSFDFFVNDVSLTGGHSIAVSGTIQNVTAVPEPETYALFLAGLGAVGFMARRRKS